jgi:hypothetical protein
MTKVHIQQLGLRATVATYGLSDLCGIPMALLTALSRAGKPFVLSCGLGQKEIASYWLGSMENSFRVKHRSSLHSLFLLWISNAPPMPDRQYPLCKPVC